MADTPFIKALVIAIFIAILVSLAAAGLNLFRDKDPSGEATVRALTWRVGLSIGLVAMLGILYALGIITPNA